MHRTWSIIAGTVLGVPLLLPGAARAQAATPLACGDEVRTDVTLRADLDCPDGDALEIATDGVTLDLGGHRITGAGGTGVLVTAADVVVRGGTLEGWNTGVAAGPATRPVSVTVERASLRRNFVGADAGAGVVTVVESQLRGNHVGALGELDGRLLVVRSDVSGNQRGIEAQEGGSVELRRTSLRQNQTGLSCWDSAFTLADTVVLGNATGVDSDGCAGSAVERSAFVRNTTHVEMADDAVPAFSCTAFLGGGPAPDLTVAPCPPSP